MGKVGGDGCLGSVPGLAGVPDRVAVRTRSLAGVTTEALWEQRWGERPKVVFW